jgi:hypothetical protein
MAEGSQATEFATPDEQEPLDYDAFLSYTHSDRPTAGAIQKGLHRIGRPARNNRNGISADAASPSTPIPQPRDGRPDKRMWPGRARVHPGRWDRRADGQRSLGLAAGSAHLLGLG